MKRGDKLLVSGGEYASSTGTVYAIAHTPNYESIEDIRGAKWTVSLDPDIGKKVSISYKNLMPEEDDDDL